MKSKFLAIIVDGYNFLLTTGMMAENVEGIELEKGRKRLLSFLASQFPTGDLNRSKLLPTKNGTNNNRHNRTTSESSKTSTSTPKLTVVFDSKTKLRLPTRLSYQGIEVKFSKGYENADELIIEMIQSFDVPKRLLVVSSDHEIQTAAKRRRATAIDSDVWLDQLESTEKSESRSEDVTAKPSSNSADTEHWLDVFSDIELNEEKLFTEEDLPVQPPPKIDSNKTTSPIAENETNLKREIQFQKDPKLEVDFEKLDIEDFDDIFPPGYGEDLL